MCPSFWISVYQDYHHYCVQIFSWRSSRLGNPFYGITFSFFFHYHPKFRTPEFCFLNELHSKWSLRGMSPQGPKRIEWSNILVPRGRIAQTVPHGIRFHFHLWTKHACKWCTAHSGDHRTWVQARKDDRRKFRWWRRICRHTVASSQVFLCSTAS